MRRPFPLFRDRLCAGAVVILLALPTGANAVSVVYEAELRGEKATLSTQANTHKGVLYVSLPSLAERLGGGFHVLPTRLRIDLMGTTAWVGINDNRVNGLTVFSLQHPVIRHDGDVLIAVADVEAFFWKAFQVTVRQRAEVQRPRTITIGADRARHEETFILGSPRAPRPQLRPATPPQRPIRVIVIDVGHGGYDVGVEGPGGVQEKSINLAIALKLEAILKQNLSQEIVLTRNVDIDVSAKQRALLTSKVKGDLFVTLHVGGVFSPQASGPAIFYLPRAEGAARIHDPRVATSRRRLLIDYGAESEAVAQALAHALERETESPLRGLKAAEFKLLRKVGMPGILVEVGCLTNPSEEALLELDSYQNKLAGGIASGLMAYLEDREPGTDTWSLQEPRTF